MLTRPSRSSSSPDAALAEPEDIDTLTDAVLTASRLLVALSARSIASVDESITIPQFRLLIVLHTHGPLKLTKLAEHLAVNPSTATRMVDRLIATGMISREANPASRRELVVSLTDTGSGVVREVTQRRRAEIARVVEQMPATSRRGLVRALTAFTVAGGEPSTAEHGSPLWL